MILEPAAEAVGAMKVEMPDPRSAAAATRFRKSRRPLEKAKLRSINPFSSIWSRIASRRSILSLCWGNTKLATSFRGVFPSHSENTLLAAGSKRWICLVR